MKKKAKIGCPTKYKPEYCQNIIDFFSVEPIIYKDITVTRADGTTIDKTEMEASPTPYFSKWQRSIGITDMTMLLWVKVHPEFSCAYKRAKQLQEEFLMECALKNCHNSTFTIFTMKNICGWRDSHEEKAQGNVYVNIWTNASKKVKDVDQAGRIHFGAESESTAQLSNV